LIAQVWPSGRPIYRVVQWTSRAKRIHTKEDHAVKVPGVQPPTPIDVTGLFAPERRALLQLLSGLNGKQWDTPTVCPGWTVKDVAIHLLGVDLGNLSVQRDGFTSASTAGPASGERAALVAFVTDLNETWVATARRLSPRILRELLTVTGEMIAAYFGTLDLLATGPAVSWAGPDPAPVWLHVSREYTERWVHQQQIREALALPGFMETEHAAPVLAAFVHALPHALRNRTALPGTCIKLTIDGPAGGRWIAVRTEDRWALGRDDGRPADVAVAIDQDLAWRLFTKGVTPACALPRVRIEGDRSLGSAVLEMVSIIA
jgi:uncharacterized protein (TIGR03083 family)